LVQSGARDGEGDDGLAQPGEPRMRDPDAGLEHGGRCLVLTRDDRAHRIGLLCRRDRVRGDEHPDEACRGVTEPVQGWSDRDQLGTQPGDEAHARRMLYRSDARMTTNAPPQRSSRATNAAASVPRYTSSAGALMTVLHAYATST